MVLPVFLPAFLGFHLLSLSVVFMWNFADSDIFSAIAFFEICQSHVEDLRYVGSLYRYNLAGLLDYSYVH